jgi:MtrB/PioB family decaheme-associated outer membrane protein
MRRRGSAAALAVALGVIGGAVLPAGAEQELGPVVVSGEAQVGGHIYWDDNNSAKFEEYRDIPEDPFGSLRFLIEDTDQRYYFQGWLDDIAEDDQQYRFESGRYGRWGISGLFSEIPHTFSNQAVSPYKQIGNNRLELRPGFDRTLAPGDPAYNAQLTPSSSTLPTPTRAQDLEFRTIEGSGEIFFKPTSAWDLSAGYRVIDRDGTRPKAFGLGSFGGNYINVAAPVEERTHEARADVQYVQETWNIGLNYTGSFFDNDIDGFSADNPLTDPADETTGASAVGRSALAPDNSAHLVSISGAGILPTSFPSQLAGSFSWGVTLQNDNFLPVTSNAAINPPPFPGDPRLTLPAKDLDGRVYTINGNVVYTARPISDVNVKVRYRIYDHNNDTDQLTFAGEAPNDRNLRDGETAIAYRYRRQNALAEATWRPGQSSVSTTVGMVWENWNRDNAREVRDMNEYGPTARVDWRAADWARLRAGYAFAARRGDRYDEQGALAGLRKYSQAELLRHRFNLLAQLDPCEDFGVTLTGAFHLTDYDDSDQGLTDDDRFDVGIEANYRLHERVNLWANYNFDYIRLYQKQGGSSWNSKARDTAHNGGAGVDFVIIPGMLDGEVSYFIQRAWAKTIGGGTAEDFPVIKDRLQAVTTALSVHPLEYLTFRGAYRWEKYDRNNFHEDFPLYTDSTGDIYLQNRIRDYDAHIFSISAILTF